MKRQHENSKKAHSQLEKNGVLNNYSTAIVDALTLYIKAGKYESMTVDDVCEKTGLSITEASPRLAELTKRGVIYKYSRFGGVNKNWRACMQYTINEQDKDKGDLIKKGTVCDALYNDVTATRVYLATKAALYVSKGLPVTAFDILAQYYKPEISIAIIRLNLRKLVAIGEITIFSNDGVTPGGSKCMDFVLKEHTEEEINLFNTQYATQIELGTGNPDLKIAI